MFYLSEFNLADTYDGHKHIVSQYGGEAYCDETIVASIKSFDDLFLLAQLSKIHYFRHLYIVYLAASRYDRKLDRNQAFDLEIVANFINSLNYVRVTILRPYSQVALDLIQLSELEDPTGCLIQDCLKENALEKDSTAFVASDFYTSKLLKQTLQNGELIIEATKQIDKIGEVLIDDLHIFSKIKNIVIVGDLCDRGDNYISIAKLCRKYDIEKVFLVITHGIFSNGLKVFDGLINKIYCTNSFANFSDPLLSQREIYKH